MLKSLTVYFVAFVTVFTLNAQELMLESTLVSTVNESSGLLYLNNTLITHNDSQNTNQLHDIDETTGLVLRTVTITNATNTDWEDLTNDDTYIYIGDFGNFRGDRMDLKVYRIAISDYFSSTSVTADVINFSYADQSDFTPSPLATNFDAEGLIHYTNSLYVFTKNWLNGNTNIYQLPKTIGTHSISMIDTVVAQGLVSGATYNASSNKVLLIGYDVLGAFLIELSGFSSGMFSNGTITKTNVSTPSGNSRQIEGIYAISQNELYISSEDLNADVASLYSFNLSTLSNEASEATEIYFYPNPANAQITLSKDYLNTKIYAITGQLVLESEYKAINVSRLKPGVYLIKIEDTVNKQLTTKRLIISQ